MLHNDDDACVREFQRTEETRHLQRHLSSYLQNNRNKCHIDDMENQELASTEEQQLSNLLIELLKFQNSEKSKGLLERFANRQLKDSELNDQHVLQINQKGPFALQRLDRSLSEPFNQQSVAKKLVNQARYKTELCRQFEEKGHCQYGEKCQFSHGEVEKRFVERHPKYKTEMCRTFHQQGFCSYGLRCNFIHNEDERRFAQVEESPDGMTQGKIVSPLPVFESELLLTAGHSNGSPGHPSTHELTRSMSVVENSTENRAFSNDFSILLHLRGLAGSPAERNPYLQSSIGSGVLMTVKSQTSRGRPILSRSVSTADHSQFSEDHTV